MDIGKKQRVIIVEPLQEPSRTAPAKELEPAQAPAPLRTPDAPATVPTGFGASQLRMRS